MIDMGAFSGKLLLVECTHFNLRPEISAGFDYY